MLCTKSILDINVSVELLVLLQELTILESSLNIAEDHLA
jgi:hypothetical protein